MADCEDAATQRRKEAAALLRVQLEEVTMQGPQGVVRREVWCKVYLRPAAAEHSHVTAATSLPGPQVALDCQDIISILAAGKEVAEARGMKTQPLDPISGLDAVLGGVEAASLGGGCCGEVFIGEPANVMFLLCNGAIDWQTQISAALLLKPSPPSGRLLAAAAAACGRQGLQVGRLDACRA